MTSEQIRAVVLEALSRIAPELAPEAVDARESLREQYDLDSMDVLTLVTALRARLGVAIPETDYQALATLDDLVSYLAAHGAAVQEASGQPRA